jgi:hypothetical protein
MPATHTTAAAASEEATLEPERAGFSGSCGGVGFLARGFVLID